MTTSKIGRTKPSQASSTRHVIASVLLLALLACWLWPARTMPTGAQTTSSATQALNLLGTNRFDIKA